MTGSAFGTLQTSIQSFEPFAKPSKISDFIPLNGFFLNSVLGMGTCPVYAGIDNTQQQEVNPCPL